MHKLWIRWRRSITTTSSLTAPPPPTTAATTIPTPTTKYQFNCRPTRPSADSECLEFLPPAKFTLLIISLSYNRPSVHTLLSPKFPSSQSIQYTDPDGLFILTAIPGRFVNLAQPIPDHIQTLSSCFSMEDQERWKKQRLRKQQSIARPVKQLRLIFSLKIKELHKSSVIPTRNQAPAQPGGQMIKNQDPAGEKSKTNDLIRLNPHQAGFERWLDSDHYYIVHRSLILNTVGLPQLIRAIRAGLESIQHNSSGGRTPHDRSTGPTRSLKPTSSTSRPVPSGINSSSSDVNQQHPSFHSSQINLDSDQQHKRHPIPLRENSSTFKILATSSLVSDHRGSFPSPPRRLPRFDQQQQPRTVSSQQIKSTINHYEKIASK
ncbi:hypothetical protein MJO28_014412 [Puccinia striiformis f. sp. tritici]|uniref:Uncharacterized protein n=1 Tax=Puccinia striiformis f. sp. tritici TaxID=168172 RepID=A0ACC0DWC6_9BASI|nr:hypothetical protein Pst134EB_027425 [Puccinia striiformis f. sp. tritici]KAI7938833.1 hypothetical protein MJO28_014412 [Puccinia striiformis f. sp. tritici]